MTGKWVRDCLSWVLLAAVLSGCAYVKPSTVDPDYMGMGSYADVYTKPGARTGDSSLLTLGNSKQKGDSSGGGIGVNAFQIGRAHV